jgi:hypothetical protein
VVNSHLLCQLSYRGLKRHQKPMNFDDFYKSLYIFDKYVNTLSVIFHLGHFALYYPKKGKKNPGERSNSGERRNRRNMISH